MSSIKQHTPKVVFYDDAPTFGGHEVMILNALCGLIKRNACQITFIYSSTNVRLEKKLRALQVHGASLSLMPLSYASGRLQFLRTVCAIRHLKRLRGL